MSVGRHFVEGSVRLIGPTLKVEDSFEPLTRHRKSLASDVVVKLCILPIWTVRRRIRVGPLERRGSTLGD